MDLDYHDTLITVADDCPVDHSTIPTARGGKETIAGLQYKMLADKPFTYTQEDVLFETWLKRQDLPEQSAEERARLREQFFSKPQACLRSSPLPKKFGWGFLFDTKGRVALCPIESPEYQEIASGQADDGTVKSLKALRSKRA